MENNTVGGRILSTKSIAKERFVYLDFIKVLAIYFVCFYHCNNFQIDILSNPSLLTYSSYFIKCISSTGVPLFFMVNGALMLNRRYDLKKHIKKITNIIVLTIVWGIITLLILGKIYGTTYTKAGFINALWFWQPGAINHLWFLQALVCVYILYPLIKEIYDKEDNSVLKYFLVTVFILTFGNVILNMMVNTLNAFLRTNYMGHDRVNLFNNFNVFRGFYGYTIVYFILGGLILEKLKENSEISFIKMLILFIIGMFGLFLYGVMMSKLTSSIYDTIWNGYDSVMTLMVCISIFCISFFIRNKIDRFSNLIVLIGENTLGIYFIHRVIGAIVRPYYVSLSFSTSVIANLMFGAIIMMLSLVVTLMLKRVPLVNRLFKI